MVKSLQILSSFVVFALVNSHALAFQVGQGADLVKKEIASRRAKGETLGQIVSAAAPVPGCELAVALASQSYDSAKIVATISNSQPHNSQLSCVTRTLAALAGSTVEKLAELSVAQGADIGAISPFLESTAAGQSKQGAQSSSFASSFSRGVGFSGSPAATVSGGAGGGSGRNASRS